MKNRGKYYLSKFLKIAPLSHALWRSCEAVVFEKSNFKKPVIDIGCGFGEFAGVTFNKIEVGIDINENDLKKAVLGKKYKKLLNADARNLPFKNNSFSTAVSVSVLEHIPQVEKVIPEAYRILKKNGLLIFSVPTVSMEKHLLMPKILNTLGMNSLAKSYFKFHCHLFKHHSLKTSSWWQKKLKAEGFEIIKMQGTVSPTLLKFHEAFLIFALPSQLWKYLFGKRLIISSGLRSKILPYFFHKYTKAEEKSDINMFFVAKKI